MTEGRPFVIAASVSSRRRSVCTKCRTNYHLNRVCRSVCTIKRTKNSHLPNLWVFCTKCRTNTHVNRVCEFDCTRNRTNSMIYSPVGPFDTIFRSCSSIRPFGGWLCTNNRSELSTASSDSVELNFPNIYCARAYASGPSYASARANASGQASACAKVTFS